MLAEFLHVSNITSCSSQDSSYVLDLKRSDILGLCSLNSGFQTKDKRKEPRGVCALSTHTDPLPRALRLYHHKHVHTSAVSSIMETDLLIFHRRPQLKEKHTWFSSLTARPSELKTQLTRSLSTEAAVDPLCGCLTNGRQKHRNTQSESLRSFQSKHQTKPILHESAAETASHFVTYMFHCSGSWSPRRIILPVRSPREGLLSSSFFSPFFPLSLFLSLLSSFFSRWKFSDSKSANPECAQDAQKSPKFREWEGERCRERGGESEGWTRFPDPDCPAKEHEDVSAEEKHKHWLLLQLRLEFIRLNFRPNHQNKSCLTEQTEQSAVTLSTAPPAGLTCRSRSWKIKYRGDHQAFIVKNTLRVRVIHRWFTHDNNLRK